MTDHLAHFLDEGITHAQPGGFVLGAEGFGEVRDFDCGHESIVHHDLEKRFELIWLRFSGRDGEALPFFEMVHKSSPGKLEIFQDCFV
jgi:hypothetical protein